MPQSKPDKQKLGSPQSAAWFRAKLAEIGETHGSIVKFMARNGDDRQPATILRNLERMAGGEARVSGEMRVLLTMRANALRKRRNAEAAGSDGGRDRD